MTAFGAEGGANGRPRDRDRPPRAPVALEAPGSGRPWSSWWSSPSGASPLSRRPTCAGRAFSRGSAASGRRCCCPSSTRSRSGRSGSSCGCSARTRSTARSPSEPSLLARPRAQPARPRAGRRAPVLMSADPQLRPRHLGLLPRLRAACSRTASSSRPPRRSASRARSTTPTSRQRDPLLPHEARHHVERPRLRRLLRQAADEVRTHAVHLRRDVSALVQVVPEGDPAVAAREAVDPVHHPQEARALRGPDPVRRAPHEPRGLLLPASRRSRRPRS